MDVYLPADFYLLRDDLNDWRDVGTANSAGERMAPEPADADGTATNGCVDPSWKVF